MGIGSRNFSLKFAVRKRHGSEMVDIRSYLEEKAGLVNSYLQSYLDRPLRPAVLMESMRYSLLAGGKRIRPILAMASHEACGGKAGDITGCAAALELIHTYSLIHDDLPAMDNDDLRRGRPTNHKVFGEAIAILAGDGLLTEAFLMLLDSCRHVPADLLVRAVRELSRAAGVRGMVGGQAQDIISENADPDADTLHFIHKQKTGALIAASVRLGGILAGAGREAMGALTGYGAKLGLAFQIVDDILDVEGDAELLGKPVGSDEKKKKMTYPSLYGVDASLGKAGDLIGEALESLDPLGERAEPLREIARYILERRH
jgi:geranylgeranyl diphosphate synthase type II